MISTIEYAGHWIDSLDWMKVDVQANARHMLNQVNLLIADAVVLGVFLPINQKTGSRVSGEIYGGFRPQNCPIGAPKSAHKTGEAVDVYDPRNELDSFLDKHPELLAKYGLYRESPKATEGWCHLQTRKTPSGKRTFLP